MIGLLIAVLFVALFVFAQGIVYLIKGTTPAKEAKSILEKAKHSSVATRFVLEKQLTLKKMGAGILLKDQMTVSQWYLYKALMAALFGLITAFIAGGVIKTDFAKPLTVVVSIIGWVFLDVLLRAQNRSSNDEMMPDIMEMSRSVLYAKRGGQYIADALKDAVIVVENKRLKTALMQFRNDMDSGKNLDDCLHELEMSFSNGEISSFCTVIKSLQATGQVDEALRTLENNIEREQISVNKRRCLMLEHKTMMYVIFIAMDILAMILFCIIMKLLEMQIGF
ncbi:MAG: type II secretion system F family protein [Lachnospiraceae bacterium]|nr:type II secretion system F family protein [Lachnospiraceae bacterium]